MGVVEVVLQLGVVVTWAIVPPKEETRDLGEERKVSVITRFTEIEFKMTLNEIEIKFLLYNHELI